MNIQDMWFRKRVLYFQFTHFESYSAMLFPV